MAIMILALLASGAMALKITEPSELSREDERSNEEDMAPFDMAWARTKLYHAGGETSPWKDLVAKHAEEIKGLKEPTIIYYGDALVEHWRGEGSGRPEKQFQNRTQLWQTMFVDRYGPSHVSGIGGDRVPNLLWRLQNGEKPAEHAQPKVIIVEIGTNDVSACFKVSPWSQLVHTISDDRCAKLVFAGYQKVVDELKTAAPDAKLLLTSIMPRHPDWTASTGVFRKVITSLNKLIAGVADNSKVYYVDCGHVLLKNGAIDRDLAGHDYLHPTHSGDKAWAECLQKPLDEILLQKPLDEMLLKMFEH